MKAEFFPFSIPKSLAAAGAGGSRRVLARMLLNVTILHLPSGRQMNFRSLLSAAVLAASAAGAVAAPITPTFDAFGTLAGATFGGSGIPNDAVAISRNGNVTIGLTAHQRYDSPAVANNGAGVFYAQTGIDTHAPSSATDPYALWNFAFYASGATSYRLSYDFDPAADNDKSTHGWFTVLGSGQDSLNLGMNSLDPLFPIFVTPPLFDTFDPLALGEYTFSLTAYGLFGRELATTAIKVIVGAAPSNNVPEPASLALVGLALAGLAVSRRKA